MRKKRDGQPWRDAWARRHDRLMELVTSRGGLAANLAGQSTENLLEARDWIDWILRDRRADAKKA